MIELSKQQAHAVMYGIRPSNKSWEPVPLPIAPQTPSWALDIHVDWMEGYANRPRVLVLTNGTEFEGDWKWKFNGKRLYTAELPDGRLQWHAHGAARLQATSNGAEAWMTSQEEGYGGRHFKIQMEDGREAILRGPWHVGAPEGFVEISTYNRTHAGLWEQKHAGHMRKLGLSARWPLTGTFGLAVREEVFLALLACFAPHFRAARVSMYGRADLEPRKAAEAPKGMEIEGQDLEGE